MAWFYEQRSGKIWRNNDVMALAVAYSGAPGAVNDPSKQHLKAVGPIPRGVYKILPAVNHPRLGPVALQLEPDEWNEMFNRDDFWMHGDNKLRNRSASKGCIIADRAPRETVNNSTDKTLVVV